LHALAAVSIVGLMKRLVVLCLLVGSPLLAQAADSLTDAAVWAAQKDSEEKYKRLAADVQTILDTQELIQKRQEEFRQRLDRLSDEIRTFKDEQGRSSSAYVSREELRKLVEKLKEQLDEQRETDKKLILNNIKELAKAPPVVPPAPKTAPKKEESSEERFIYEVKKNDRLLDIVAKYNEYFQEHGQSKITLEQVLKANEGLNPNKLVAGRKIRIPIPPKTSK
jgi:hypothetical protein